MKKTMIAIIFLVMLSTTAIVSAGLFDEGWRRQAGRPDDRTCPYIRERDGREFAGVLTWDGTCVIPGDNKRHVTEQQPMLISEIIPEPEPEEPECEEVTTCSWQWKKTWECDDKLICNPWNEKPHCPCGWNCHGHTKCKTIEQCNWEWHRERVCETHTACTE